MSWESGGCGPSGETPRPPLARDTTDDAVMILGLPVTQAFPSEYTELLRRALRRAYDDDVTFTAGERVWLHHILQVFELVELTRPYHEATIAGHPGKVFRHDLGGGAWHQS